jgi:hypothetical protein
MEDHSAERTSIWDVIKSGLFYKAMIRIKQQTFIIGTSKIYQYQDTVRCTGAPHQELIFTAVTNITNTDLLNAYFADRQEQLQLSRVLAQVTMNLATDLSMKLRYIPDNEDTPFTPLVARITYHVNRQLTSPATSKLVALTKCTIRARKILVRLFVGMDCTKNIKMLEMELNAAVMA